MFYLEGEHSFFMGCRATLIQDDYETASAWAKPHIVINPANSWIVGKFVEADRPNNNKHVFSMEGLTMGKPSIAHAPMNINHSRDDVIGSFVAAELILPTTDGSTGDMPYIETAGVLWKYYYPDAYDIVAKAHNEGALFQSMECIPRALRSVGGADDSKEYAYEGRQHWSYPQEINERSCEGIELIDPWFIGGAQIVPPVRPGWSNANVSEVSQFMTERWKEAEMAYDQITQEAPDLAAKEWESVMENLVGLAVLSDLSKKN